MNHRAGCNSGTPSHREAILRLPMEPTEPLAAGSIQSRFPQRPAWLLASLFALSAVFFIFAALVHPQTPGLAMQSVLASLAVILAALGYGLALIRLSPPFSTEFRGASPAAKWERRGAAVLFGLGAVWLGAFSAGALGILGTPASVSILAGGWLAAILFREPGGRRPHRSPRQSFTLLPLAAFLLPVFSIALLASLAPPTWFDALEYHLAIPANDLIQGRLAEMPDNFFSHFPHGIELVDALLLALGRSLHPAPLHFAIGIAAALCVSRLARRHLHRGAGALAAAIFFSFGDAGYSLFVEGVDLAAAGAAALAFDLFLSSSRRRASLPAAFFAAGLAASFKPVAGASVGIILAATALLTRRNELTAQGRLRSTVLAAGLFAAPLLPWAILNFARHHNPIYPLGQSLFGGDPVDASWLDWIRWYTRQMAIDHGSAMSFPAAFFGKLFNPSDWNPLPLAIFAAPIVLIRRRNVRDSLLLAVGALVLWEVIAAVPRYFLPGLTILSALAAAAILSLLARLGRPARFTGALLVTAILGFSAWRTITVTIETRDMFHVLSGSETKEDYGVRIIPGSPGPVFDWANRNLPLNASVLSLDEPRLFGLWRPFQAATLFDRRPLRRFLIGAGANDPGDVAGRMRDAGFTHLLLSPAQFDRLASEVGTPYVYGPADRQFLARLLFEHTRVVFEKNGVRLVELTAPGRRAEPPDPHAR